MRHFLGGGRSRDIFREGQLKNHHPVYKSKKNSRESEQTHNLSQVGALADETRAPNHQHVYRDNLSKIRVDSCLSEFKSTNS